MDIRDKIRGSLIGGAVGDALGYPVEFDSDTVLWSRFGTAGIMGYELINGRALLSDDTQMTLFSANGIINAVLDEARGENGESVTDYVYNSYIDWLETQGISVINADPLRRAATRLFSVTELHARRAPGNTCIYALEGGKRSTIDKPINNSKGCGGIMRVAPFGLTPCFDAERAFDEASAAAVLTHGHVFGWMPAGILAYIINKIVFEGLDPEAASADCRGFLKNRYTWDAADALIRWLSEAEGLSKMSMSDKTAIERLDAVGNPAKGGWTGESALYIALYSVLKYRDDFDKAVICAVNCGEDRDSTGAVAGNIIGAVTGMSGISRKWLTDLELRDTVIELADDLFACGRLDDPETRKNLFDKYTVG